MAWTSGRDVAFGEYWRCGMSALLPKHLRWRGGIRIAST